MVLMHSRSSVLCAAAGWLHSLAEDTEAERGRSGLSADIRAVGERLSFELDALLFSCTSVRRFLGSQKLFSLFAASQVRFAAASVGTACFDGPACGRPSRCCFHKRSFSSMHWELLVPS